MGLMVRMPGGPTGVAVGLGRRPSRAARARIRPVDTEMPSGSPDSRTAAAPYGDSACRQHKRPRRRKLAGGPTLWPLPRVVQARLSHAMKTYVANSEDRQRDWLVVDATGQTLGRLATRIADALRGKNKPTYTPHVDTGDFVIVVNAEKIAVTGNKLADKKYYRHSGYPGGLKTRTLAEQLERRPEEVIRKAVKGMLPRNRLARKQITKLKVYAGPEHPHVAQKPQPMETPS